MGHSGLRRSEVLEVTPQDIVRTSAGPRVRIWGSKGDKDRETIASDELLTLAETITDISDRSPSDPMIETDYPRTVGRWVKRAAACMHEQTGDRGWEYLSPHDLRGTWATLMRHEYSVDVMLVMDWVAGTIWRPS